MAKKPLNKKLSWKNLLKNGKNLPQNWLKMTGVLVSVDQMAHQGNITDIPEELP